MPRVNIVLGLDLTAVAIVRDEDWQQAIRGAGAGQTLALTTAPTKRRMTRKTAADKAHPATKTGKRMGRRPVIK